MMQTGSRFIRKANTPSVFVKRTSYATFYVNPKDERALKAIIAVNFAVFMNWRMGWPLTYTSLQNNFIASTNGVFYQKKFHTLLTSAVSHMDFGHFLANMVTFYFFGQNVFYAYGRKFGLGLYFVSATLSTFAQVYQGYRYKANVAAIGASGAVSSFVVFSILMNPRATVLIWMVLPIPAALFGAGFILQDIWGLSHPTYRHGGLVGHEAHLVGSAVGAFAFLAKRRLWI